MAYCMAMIFIFLKISLMIGTCILKLLSNSFINGMCAAARVDVVITIRGSIFEPLAIILSISSLYRFALVSSISGENPLLQYLN